MSADQFTANYNPASRFQFQDQIVVNGENTYGLWQPPWFISNPDMLAPDQVNNYYVTSGQEGRPDLIAATIYGTPYLDWVLIAFNHPRDPFNWPAAGTVIQAPQLSVILPFIN